MDPVERILARARKNGTSATTTEYKCALCKDTGYIIRKDEEGYRFARICDCAKRRQALERLKRAGLAELVERCTLEGFQTPEPWQETLRQKAQDYVDNGAGAWFFLGGGSGSGKTHLCTAIVGAMAEKGKLCSYLRWREDAPRLKAYVNDRDRYEEEIKPFKESNLLYIDDFWKGTVTDGDINLAFEILDYRYNKRRPTIISSEWDIERILSADEAVGSRIFELSRGYCLKTQPQNWRLRR